MKVIHSILPWLWSISQRNHMQTHDDKEMERALNERETDER